MVRVMPEPCEFPSVDSRKKQFLRNHKGVDLASHPSVGLVLQVGEAERFPQAFGLESLNLFSQSACAVQMETTRDL